MSDADHDSSNTDFDEDTSLRHEYDIYANTAQQAFGDSIRTYENMDKWMLSLSGGALGVSAALATQESRPSWILFLGIVSFAVSACVLLYSKYKSYKMSEEACEEIEKAYKSNPTNFSTAYYHMASEAAKEYNKSNELKNLIGLWAFIIGVLFLTISTLPIDLCNSSKEYVDDDTSGTAQKDASAATSEATAKGPPSTQATTTSPQPQPSN